MLINCIIGAFFVNENNAIEFQRTDIYNKYRRICAERVFTVNNEFLLANDYHDDLHNHLCKNNYRPYVKFIAKYLQAIDMIEHFEYVEHVFDDFFVENSFIDVAKYFTNLDEYQFDCSIGYIYDYAVSVFGFRNKAFEKRHDIEYPLVESVSLRDNDEVAHIFFCMVPEYVLFCKKCQGVVISSPCVF